VCVLDCLENNRDPVWNWSVNTNKPRRTPETASDCRQTEKTSLQCLFKLPHLS